MLKQVFLFALMAMVAAAPSKESTTASGSWLVDGRHSDAQLVADGTTDYGKTKMNITLGFGRIVGKVLLDDQDESKSKFEFSIYPANSPAPAIDENGKLQNRWLENLSNHTLVCFHSKQVVRKPDGTLEAIGTLVLTRVDRNVEATPSEAYAGPVYGPPMLHRITQEATFVFRQPVVDDKAGIQTSGTAGVYREDFPQLVKAVINTYWPPLVQDKSCTAGTPNEGYSGAQCTGTFLEAPALRSAPSGNVGEDFPGPQDFNSIVGEHLTVLVHLHLAKLNAPAQAAGGY